MDHCLLVVIVSPSMENAMVDWLLDREDVPGFTSIPVYGHGASAQSMTPAEQVAGRQRRIMFQLHLAQETAAVIIEALNVEFGGSGMHYWQVAVLASGHLS
jgi:hypothetical protein